MKAELVKQEDERPINENFILFAAERHQRNRLFVDCIRSENINRLSLKRQRDETYELSVAESAP